MIVNDDAGSGGYLADTVVTTIRNIQVPGTVHGYAKGVFEAS